jgi:predicted  nucleic acid-binding Zn-ribbon protein
VLTYKQFVEKLAGYEIIPQGEIAEFLKQTGQTEEHLNHHVERQRKVDALNNRIRELRQFFARGATLSEEIQVTRKALQESEQAYAAWGQEVREQGASKNEELQRLEAELHVLWPTLVADLHEAGVRKSSDW